MATTAEKRGERSRKARVTGGFLVIAYPRFKEDPTLYFTHQNLFVRRRNQHCYFGTFRDAQAAANRARLQDFANPPHFIAVEDQNA